MMKIWKALAATSIACGIGAAMLVAAWLFVPPPQQAAAQFADQGTYGGVSTGSANAQAFTINNLVANKPGIILRFIPGYTNTGPTQINVSGIGLVNVLRPSSIGLVAFSGGEFQANEMTCVSWNSAVSAYQLACNIDMTRIGQSVEYRGSAVPRGTLIEDGSCVSQTTYAALYSVIGTSYNATAPVACGAGTFAVPFSNGRAFFALDTQGANTAGVLTSAGSGCNGAAIGLCGQQNVTIAQSGLPNITFSKANGNLTDPGHTHGVSGGTIGGTASNLQSGATTETPVNAEAIVINSAFTGISFALNGGVTQTPTTALPPGSLGYRAIKY